MQTQFKKTIKTVWDITDQDFRNESVFISELDVKILEAEESEVLDLDKNFLESFKQELLAA